MKSKRNIRPTSAWAIAYDLDVAGMRTAGYSKSQVTLFYNSVRDCLRKNNFELLKQLSIYTCSTVNSIADAFRAIQDLRGVKDTDKFIKRLNLFRVEDFNDLMPLVADGRSSAESDEVEEEIEEVFGKHDA